MLFLSPPKKIPKISLTLAQVSDRSRSQRSPPRVCGSSAKWHRHPATQATWRPNGTRRPGDLGDVSHKFSYEQFQNYRFGQKVLITHDSDGFKEDV